MLGASCLEVKHGYGGKRQRLVRDSAHRNH